jgi:hypothetical protein
MVTSLRMQAIMTTLRALPVAEWRLAESLMIGFQRMAETVAM